jgi:hypothetical protein
VNLAATLWAYGTSEGVIKAWDTRGRGGKLVAAITPHGFKHDKSKGHSPNTRLYTHPSKGKFSLWDDGHWKHRKGSEVQDEGHGAASLHRYVNTYIK